MDRFLLAENPMNSGGGSLAVIHTIDPVAIIQVHEGHIKTKSTCSRHYMHNSSEAYTLSIHFQFSRSLADSEAQVQEASKLLDKAWRWFRNYMDWEDEQ